MEAAGKKTTVTDLLSLLCCENIDETSLHQRFIDRRWQDTVLSDYVNLAMAVGRIAMMTPVVYNAEKTKACQDWL